MENKKYSEQEKRQILDTLFKKFGGIDHHAMIGYVVQAVAILESCLDIVISKYYCYDMEKTEDHVAIIQEVSISKKIDFFLIILKDIKSEAYDKNYKFKYLKAHGSKEQKFKNALLQLKDIRNKFSHTWARVPEAIQEPMKLVSFIPRTKKGVRNDMPIKEVLTLTQEDLSNLKSDLTKIAQVIKSIQEEMNRYCEEIKK